MKFKSKELSKFQKEIKTLSSKELKSLYTDIALEDNKFSKLVYSWFKHKLEELDQLVTYTFHLDQKTSRGDHKEFSENTVNTFLRSYIVVQEFLSRKYPEEYISLYRGLYGENILEKINGKKLNFVDYNVTSWSKNIESAKEFALMHKDGIVVISTFPLDRILFCSDLPFSKEFETEEEYIVYGSKTDSTIIIKQKGYEYIKSTVEL